MAIRAELLEGTIGHKGRALDFAAYLYKNFEVSVTIKA